MRNWCINKCKQENSPGIPGLFFVKLQEFVVLHENTGVFRAKTPKYEIHKKIIAFRPPFVYNVLIVMHTWASVTKEGTALPKGD